ncbi:unnamed protein product [Danaus chrysippus]|uniref:(African queen) hypothetical protein n=1 Tax=Danaus chrysippus TaxID=151541 RepID=A0A8J2QIJ4_9NEOP|nr:unnamed protein product [Danaus chrysippus]
MSVRDQNISRWLEECDSDSEDERDVPEIPNEDCSDVEDVPLDHVIDGECQSDSEIDVYELREDDDDLPVDDASSDDDVLLARYRNYYGKNRFRWSSQPPVSRSRTFNLQPPGLKRNTKRLTEDLVEPYLRRRINQFGLQRELQNTIGRVLKIDEEPRTSSADSSDKLEKR